MISFIAMWRGVPGCSAAGGIGERVELGGADRRALSVARVSLPVSGTMRLSVSARSERSA